MPALLPVPGVIKVRLVGNLGAAIPWNVLLHTRYVGTPPNNANMNAYAAAIGGVFGAELAALMNTGAALTEVQVVDLTSFTAASGVASVDFPGTRVGTPFSAQVAMVASWHAQVRWRGGHFRSYFPFGVIADRLDVRTWTPTFIAAAEAALSAFQSAMNALAVVSNSVTMVGVSRFTNNPIAGTRRDPPLVVTIDNSVVHPRLDTQRRRLGKEHA